MKPAQFEYRIGLLIILWAGIITVLSPAQDHFMQNVAATLVLIGLGFFCIGYYIEGFIR
jgi:hypothetical protein